MGLYDIAKDVLKTAQKLDNIELVQKILDLQSGVLELQDENQKLRKKFPT